MANKYANLVGTDKIKDSFGQITTGFDGVDADIAAHLAEKASNGVHGLATTANITYYVNVATGNDGNDGLTSGTAFKTIQAAINKLPQIINHTVTINLAAGAYPENVSVSGFVGKGTLTIKGDSAVSTSYSCLSVTVNNCYLFVDIRGIYSTATDRVAFFAQNCSNTRFINCNVVTAAQYGYLFADASGYVSICNASNRSSGIRATGPCVVVSEANTGSGNTIALQAIYAATIGKVGTQPTGTTAESPGQGGVIR